MVASEAANRTDAQLVQAIRRGDTEAFEQLYARHSAVAFRVARGICRSQQAAEEATQDAFLGVWRRSDSYRPERGSVRTWLLGIVYNRSIDLCRRENSRLRLITGAQPPEEMVAAGLTDREVIDREQAESVREALVSLPPDQARAVVMAYFGGMTQSEIAEEADIPLGTVKGRMRLGLARMREYLGPDAGPIAA